MIVRATARAALVAALAATACAMAGAAEASARAAKPGPEACRQAGYTQLFRQDGSGFETRRACRAYATGGGRLAQFALDAAPIDCGGPGVCFTPIISGFGLQPGSEVRVTAYTESGGPGPVSYAAAVIDGTVRRDAGDVIVGCGDALTGSPSAYVIGTAVTAEGATITLAPIPTPWCAG